MSETPRPTASTAPPADRFALFGFGPRRRKLLFQSGRLRDALTGEVLAGWDRVADVRFEPADYRVRFDTPSGPVAIVEDEGGVWIDERRDRRAVTGSADVRLPTFAGHPQAALLRALHAELLVNVMPWGPVPNLWVYPRPWYRDAAMMGLALAATGNAGLLEPWVAGLHQPYDYNNAGHAESDNLGQVLYLLSLVGASRSSAIVDAVLAAAKQQRTGQHLSGSTDFGAHPVYQTKWLKYGLRALGLDDADWTIPTVPDTYDALFWMDYGDHRVPATRFDDAALGPYPYLNWAQSHRYAEPPPETLSADTFPLTREVRASQATYHRLHEVAPAWSTAQWSSPHTWHGAEIFLYYVDPRVSPQG